MDVRIKIIAAHDDALELAPVIETIAGEVSAEFRDTPIPEGVGVQLVKRHFAAPETVFAVASDGATGERLGLCVTAPLEDPLLGERLPLIVVLYVDSDYRHRGLARHLVEAVTRELESRGIQKLAARAGHNDDALISMGERWGFVRHWEVMLRE